MGSKWVWLWSVGFSCLCFLFPAYNTGYPIQVFGGWAPIWTLGNPDAGYRSIAFPTMAAEWVLIGLIGWVAFLFWGDRGEK